MKALATVSKGLKSISALCDGHLEIILGNVSGACNESSGLFFKAINSSVEHGTVLVAAMAKVCLAEHSRAVLSTKISEALAALEAFSKAEAFTDKLGVLLLLAQLDPKNNEFRELVREPLFGPALLLELLTLKPLRAGTQREASQEQPAKERGQPHDQPHAGR
jgi:hypothetical protein